MSHSNTLVTEPLMSDKKPLYHSDVIMSYRGGNKDREESLYAVLQHFDLTYTDYRILLIEADDTPKFNWARLADEKIQYLFIHHKGPFPKALLYNMGAKLASSQILVFNDIDCLSDPESLKSCVYELMTFSAHDVLCPYFETIDVSGELKERFIKHPSHDLFSGINKNALTADTKLLYERNTGGVFLFKRKDFIRIGGLNTHLSGWGGEDSELLYRASRLGLRWSSLSLPLFHLNHDSLNRSEWGVSTHEGMANGAQAALSETMPMEELQALADQLHQFFI